MCYNTLARSSWINTALLVAHMTIHEGSLRAGNGSSSCGFELFLPKSHGLNGHELASRRRAAARATRVVPTKTIKSCPRPASQRATAHNTA